MSANDIGIDLGTANTLVHLKSKGIVLSEPSVVALDNRNGKVIAAGNEAKQMIGRTPENITAVRPLKYGVISDFEYTGAMLKYFMKKVFRKPRYLRPDIVICAPSGITQVEKKALENLVSTLGARRITVVEETMAGAIGSGIDVLAASGSMIVDIGGGTSEIAVISLGGIVASRTVRLGGDVFDSDIVEYIRSKYGIVIGKSTAECLKIGIGTVLDGYDDVRELICGRNLMTQMPCSVWVTGEDVRCALIGGISKIVEEIKSVLEEIAPELSSDILKNGIILTGGGALIEGIDRIVCNATGMPVRIADRPLLSVVEGAGILIDKGNKLKY